MRAKRNPPSMSRYATHILTTTVLMASGTAPTQGRAQRNFYGMHTLMDGGAPIPEAMNWTRHRIGEGGYVFDRVRGSYGQWVVNMMDRISSSSPEGPTWGTSS